VEVLGGEGPELSDTEALKYFHDKLKMASKIPFMRFDKESPAGYEVAAEGMMRDEVRFNRFVERLRSIFKEILVKPLYIQMILDHPELKDDIAFKAGITVEFNSNNIFEELKSIELSKSRLEYITTLRNDLVEQDSEMNDVPYWDLDFLIERYGKFDEDDLNSNKKYKLSKTYIKDGYSKEDSWKIVNGEDIKKFKKKEKDDNDEDDL
jgi:hypothetical protein